MAYGTASSALAQVVTPHWLATYGPSLALVALVVVAHWGVYQGPVVFTVADVGFLLGGPLSRRALSVRRLAWAHVAGAALGALVAAVLLIGLGGEHRGVDATQIVGVTVGLVELGLLGVAAAWAVERSERAERAFRLALWPVAALAAALAFAGADAAFSTVAAAVVLAPLTVVAVTFALRGSGHCSAERHMRRAEARATAVASIASFDVRTARRGLARAAAARESWSVRADLRRLRALSRGHDELTVVVARRDGDAALTGARARGGGGRRGRDRARGARGRQARRGPVRRPDRLRRLRDAARPVARGARRPRPHPGAAAPARRHGRVRPRDPARVDRDGGRRARGRRVRDRRRAAARPRSSPSWWRPGSRPPRRCRRGAAGGCP